MDQTRLTRTLSLWWPAVSSTFPKFPEARYTVFMFFESRHRNGGLDISYAMARMVDAAHYRYGPENVMKVLGISYAITPSGTYAFLLLDHLGWQAFQDDADVMGTSEERLGFKIMARPPGFADRLDDEWLQELIEIRRWVIAHTAIISTNAC